MKMGKLVLSTLAGGILLSGGTAWADAKIIGQQEFQSSCAVCHGVDGKGNGPFLDFMKQTPPDLTLISQRYNGKFPFEQIYKWIEDPAGVRAHGTQDMPIWGQRYSMEVISRYGPLDTAHKGEVQARILELVFYLATIQK